MNNKKYIGRALSVPTFINYTFLSLLLIDRLFPLIFGVSGVYSALMLLLSLSVFLAIVDRQNYLNLMLKVPIIFWTIWAIYNYINWESIGIVNTQYPLQFVLSSFVYPIVTMCIVYYEGVRNMKRTTMVVLISLAIYVVVGFLFQDVSDFAQEIVSTDKRGETKLGNLLPLNACILTFFSIVACSKGWISKKWMYALLVFSLLTILFVATRKAAGGWAIIVVMWLFKDFNLRKPSNILKVFLIVGAFFFAYEYIMEDTYLGERFMTTEEQGENVNDTEIKELNYLGDRASHYILGWELFLEHPINGIGLRNFQIVADSPFVIHSEYIVQICECGLIGTSLYLLFMGGLIVRIFKTFNNNRNIFFICFGGLLCILFINFTAWTYDGNSYFAMYGLILALCHHEKNNKVGEKKPNHLLSRNKQL